MTKEDNYSLLAEGLTGDKLIPVSNLSRRRVAYTLPELHVDREWRQFEEGHKPDLKNIPFAELYALNNTPGGRQLIWDNLLIDDDPARKALELPLSDTTPEVAYTREEVRKILRDGTEDEILDMLDFGPYYIAEWAKEEAINIDSSSRREFIGKVFRIDVNNVEANVKWAAEDSEAGRLQYGTIQGQENVGGTAIRTRRTSNTKTNQEINYISWLLRASLFF